MDLSITVLGSGSGGNATLVTHGEDGILIDAGFSRKELLGRLALAGVSPKSLKAILLTHEHADHVNGARVLAEHLSIPTFATRETARHLGELGKLGSKIVLFEAGGAFDFLGFHIQPFSVPHDAVDPVGFVIGAKGATIGVATDMGFVDQLAKCRLKGCDALVLESNHDMTMLRNSQRPQRLIRRIASRHGHLSNDAAAAAMEELLTERSRFLFLGHVSGECNRYELVEAMAARQLASMARPDIVFSLMRQEAPLPTMVVA